MCYVVSVELVYHSDVCSRIEFELVERWSTRDVCVSPADAVYRVQWRASERGASQLVPRVDL